MTDVWLDALAVFRAWRLVARDDITEPVRSRWESWLWDRAHTNVTPGKSPRVPRLIVLVGCPYCLGFYLCVAAVVWSRTLPRSWRFVRAVFATSALVGIVAEWESRLAD